MHLQEFIPTLVPAVIFLLVLSSNYACILDNIVCVVTRPVLTTSNTTTTTSVTVKQPTKPVDVAPPPPAEQVTKPVDVIPSAPVTTVKQQQPPPAVTVKVTKPSDVTSPPPATISDTVTETKPSEDAVPSEEPTDTDTSNDLVVIRSASNPMDKGACNSVCYQCYGQNSNMASSVTTYIIGYIILMCNRDTLNGLLLHRLM